MVKWLKVWEVGMKVPWDKDFYAHFYYLLTALLEYFDQLHCVTP